MFTHIQTYKSGTNGKFSTWVIARRARFPAALSDNSKYERRTNDCSRKQRVQFSSYISH